MSERVGGTTLSRRPTIENLQSAHDLRYSSQDIGSGDHVSFSKHKAFSAILPEKSNTPPFPRSCCLLVLVRELTVQLTVQHLPSFIA